ncbi:MAG: EAL domain-containing protein [Proteobacteria bacterium]|nr:EAL domain-containing protein [Pseudomonadota bacterium]
MSQRTKTQPIRSLDHVLGVIESCARILDETLPANSQFRAEALEIRSAAAHGAQLTRDLLTPPVLHASPTTRPRVLVADDDRTFLKIAAALLTHQGFDVVAVDDGRGALAALAMSIGPQSFDAIVSDVQMPNCDGIELLREVRRVDLDVPVILMSGTLDVASATAAIEYGAFRYVAKPIEPARFAEVVRHATRAHALARLRREAQQVTGSIRRVSDRAGLEVRFEQAIDGMWMAFQPIVYASGAPFGFEALMRSREASMATPGAILDAAEALDRVTTVGRRVRALVAAHRHDGVLFVNLHSTDLFDPELLDPTSPLTTIASTVVLEITERAQLTWSPELASRIARLRELGFRLAIDDIGAGYSGLTTFTEVEPELVKLDMALVREVHRSTLKQRTIHALCTLCHEFGSLVVAEGVETVEEQDLLVSLGCDLLQGYLIGRPSNDAHPRATAP